MESRVHIVIMGAVQGVGFRPFIFRLAKEMNLNGYVLNSSQGVLIEAEGNKNILDEFILRIEKEKPSLSVITSLEFSFLDPKGYHKFEIKESEKNNEIAALILPDIAVCKECLEEMFDPNDRRFLYPFINCTNCGPRFSIIESLPYDRPNTSMKVFEMCEDCRKEYENPLNRRFHAQPIACPRCGPHLELWDDKGNILSAHHSALVEAANKIKQGSIIAFKGLGGFQLIVDSRNDKAVSNLRIKKCREEKPFALMFPDLEFVKQVCEVSPFEERLLLSAESPIVLLKKKRHTKILSELVAPANPYLGVMLPYTPLHHILMKELNFPIVATSGNLSEEPICIDEYKALKRLKEIAEYFLVHNRPIVRHVDDSIVRVVLDREMVIRRARGYAPLPIKLKNSNYEKSILAVGGHLKNTIALKVKDNMFISQHIGDLSIIETFNCFNTVIEDFQKLYEVDADQVVCDSHPEYLSTKYAKSLNKNFYSVQHHYAHIASCRAENQVEGNALGVAWDGTGYGLDGMIWGGEFFISGEDSYKHIGQFRQFRLPGGESAIKEPKRSAAGLLYEIFGDDLFNKKFSDICKNFGEKELLLIQKMLNKKINCPLTSSVGRIFDAVSSLIDIAHVSNYEGQSAMMLEFAADPNIKGSYSFFINYKDKFIVDWEKTIKQILKDKLTGIDSSVISAKFHNTLAQIILDVAENIKEEKVILSGGVFQNVFLVERTVKLLEQNKFKVYRHQRVPPNDGGISLGQIAYLSSKKENKNLMNGELKNVFSSSR
ncbi:MAG: carbamoyltransferase HypF [Ignavibacteriaceae bacterium]